MIKSIKRLKNSLTIEQMNDLLMLLDECKRLGARTKQLAPLYAVCLLRKPTDLTKEEIAYAEKLGKKLVDNWFDGTPIKI